MQRKMNDRRIGSGYPIVRRTTSVVAKPAVMRYPRQFSFIPNRRGKRCAGCGWRYCCY